MQKRVPPVQAKLMIEVNQAVVEEREKHGSTDVTISAVRTLHGRYRSEEILAVTHRLFALAAFLKTGDGASWLKEETGKDFVLLNDALFKAAARAPLEEGEYIKDYLFQKDTFLPIVLEESETEGAA
jgi:hypothetical protein